jgi:hypothetical protein
MNPLEALSDLFGLSQNAMFIVIGLIGTAHFAWMIFLYIKRNPKTEETETTSTKE